MWEWVLSQEVNLIFLIILFSFLISYSQALRRTIIRLRKKIRKLESAEDYVTNLYEELGHREQEVEYLRSLLDIEYTIGHLG